MVYFIMSKKNRNNNNNVNVEVKSGDTVESIDSAMEEVNIEDGVNAEISREDSTIESNADEVNTTDTDIIESEDTSIVNDAKEDNIESPVVDTTDTDTVVDDSVVVKEDDLEEESVPDVTIAKATDNADNEGSVEYFIQLNKDPFDDAKLIIVEARLSKYDLKHFITADGIVLVGPYLTREGVINGRRLVIRSGLKGDIVEIPVDESRDE